jgi:hypothetical protein
MRQMSWPGRDPRQSFRHAVGSYGSGEPRTIAVEEPMIMHPVAAYYIFMARENERDIARKYEAIRPPRPSLLARAGSLAARLRPTPRIATRPDRTATAGR